MTRAQVPTLTGPLPNTAEDHQFNSVRDYDVPLDLDAYGFVEEEYFVSGTAAVYNDDLSVQEEIPYTNRLIVRRPADPATASGKVFVEILNPSNGYDAEGMWRRAWDWYLDQRHTYVAFSIKPITIDALKIFNPVRYAPLSWERDPANPHEPVGVDFNPLGMVPGAEEGLAWDVITQAGNLLRSETSAPILGGLDYTHLVLMGQSQSGQYLNTWLRHFHPLVPELWDAFFVSVGATIERPLRTEPTTELGTYPIVVVDDFPTVTKPLISVTCEGDVALYYAPGAHHVAKHGTYDGELCRHWFVPGASHTELTTPVMPGNPGVVRAGRKPRKMSEETWRTGNIFPLHVAITAGLDAVTAWVDGTQPPASIYLDVDADDAIVRDADNNALGGIRYGIMARPVATFIGGTGGTLGTVTPFKADRVLAEYPTEADYVAAVAEVDRELQQAGYLNNMGFHQLQQVAGELWRRAAANQ